MDKKTVAATLEQIAAYLELQGENPFRVRAFRSAAKTVEGFPGDLAPSIADGSLAQAKGIGPAILQVITELVERGRSEMFETLREEVPPGLVEMLAISGLGVAKIRQIHASLGIETLTELEEAAHDGRLAALPRFGARTAEGILKGIAFLRRSSQLRLAHHARQEAREIADALVAVPHVLAAHPAGEVRRRSEVVRDLVVVAVADVPPSDVFRALGGVAGVSEVGGEDERRAVLRFAGGPPVQVIVTPPQNLGAVLVQATGSEAHLDRLTRLAAEQGYTLAGAALWKGSQFIPTPDEETLYHTLALPWIPPELRESGDELGRPVPRLLERGDLKGLLHCHTQYSDGTNTVKQIADACQRGGLRVGGDHRPFRALRPTPGGCSPTTSVGSGPRSTPYNAGSTAIRVLKGIESDILVDGAPRLSRRRDGGVRLRDRQRALALHPERAGNDRSVPAGDRVAVGQHHRPSDRATAAVARGLSGRSRRHLRGRGSGRGRNRDQRRPASPRPRLAGAAPRPRGGGDDLDRFRCAQRRRTRQRRLRRRHRSQGWPGSRRHPQLPHRRRFPGVRGRSRRLMPRESKAARQARALRILAALKAEYPDAHCELDHTSAYQLLVATILSAQCTDARVNMVTPALFTRYPDPESLAAAKQADVEELIRSTGFFRNKAKSLIGMARAVVADHGGEIPRTMEELRPLPGVGRKTANVILGNAFGINEGITVDTHVKRLAGPDAAHPRDRPRQGRARPDDCSSPRRLGAAQSPADLARPASLHRQPAGCATSAWCAGDCPSCTP